MVHPPSSLRKSWHHLWVAGLLASLLLPLVVRSQVSTTQERDLDVRSQQEQVRQQQQTQQQRQQQERSPDVRLSSPLVRGAPPLPRETPCFLMERLELNNARGQKASEFDAVVEQLTSAQAPAFLGQCVGAQGVAWAIERTQEALVNVGFVTTRVFATQQDISRGTLALTVIPGRIRAIRLTEPVDPRANLSNALPMQAGDVLNLRDIEQALENLKRAPTAEADIQIQPSQANDAQPGDSDLVVTFRQPFPLRLAINADDSGTKATGRYQGSLTISYDNALGLNDLFYVTNSNGLGGGNSGPKGTHANTIHYSLPIGYWMLGATAGTSRYHQTVAGATQSYVYQGTSENNEIKLSRILLRDGKQKLNWSIRAFQRKNNNYIDDTEVQTQKRVVGGWESALNHKTFIDQSTLESTLTYKRGTGAFGSLPAPEEKTHEGTSRFAVVLADMNLTVPFKLIEQRVRYNTVWRIQKNNTSLTPQDRFVIGGRYTVRGYDGEAVLSAERGWLWRNDLNVALRDSGHEFYVAMDTGHVGGPTSHLLLGKRLTGAAMGLRGSLQKLSYDVFVAAPVDKPNLFKTARHTTGFSLILNY